jgi:hypothetical protein
MTMSRIYNLSYSVRRQLCLGLAALIVYGGLMTVSVGVDAVFRVAQAEVTHVMT